MRNLGLLLLFYVLWIYNISGQETNTEILVSAEKPPPLQNIERNTPDDALQDMALVEGGTFMMGSKQGDYDEIPVHKVELKSFYIDKYEVTNAQFCKFLNEKGNKFEGGSYWLEIDDEDCNIIEVDGVFKPKPGFENNPVIEVSWYAANAYAKWCGKRLPTEAEWEYAAGGGSKSRNMKYAGSNVATDVAWFDSNSDGKTYPIGQLKANELGIYDMSGNVWEWVSDWYAEDFYEESPKKNPTGPPKKDFKVLRGGSWVSVEDEVRISRREYAYPYSTYYLNGFRCAKNYK